MNWLKVFGVLLIAVGSILLYQSFMVLDFFRVIVLLVFIAFQFATVIVNDTFFPYEIFIAWKFKRILMRSVTSDWKVYVSYTTASYENLGIWDIYAEARNRKKPWIWTNEIFRFKPDENRFFGEFTRYDSEIFKKGVVHG